MSIKVEVSPGELVDKLTILEIKLEHIADPQKQKNLRFEYDYLCGVYGAEVQETPEIQQLRARLKEVNQIIWDVEERIRDSERRADFGPEFITQARTAYLSNDERSLAKRRINELMNSPLVEEKSHH